MTDGAHAHDAGMTDLRGNQVVSNSNLQTAKALILGMKPVM